MTGVTLEGVPLSIARWDNGSILVGTSMGLFRADLHNRSVSQVTTPFDDPVPVTSLWTSSSEGSRFDAIAGIVGGVLVPGRDPEWDARLLPQSPSAVSGIVVTGDSKDDLVLVATASDGVSQTNDGKEWSAWNFGLYDLRVTDIVVGLDKRIIIATETGLYTSSGDGTSWKPVGFPEELVPARLVVSRESDGPRITMVGTENNGVWFQSGEGNDWKRLDICPDSGPVNDMCLVSSTCGDLTLAVAEGTTVWIGTVDALGHETAATSVDLASAVTVLGSVDLGSTRGGDLVAGTEIGVLHRLDIETLMVA